MKKIAVVVVLVSLLAATHDSRAADYKGADAILKQIAAQKGAKETDADAKASSPEKLKAELAAFRDTASKLPPEEAAKRWLDLAERYSEIPYQELNAFNETSQGESFEFQAVVAVLPPPSTWDALAKATEALPVTGDATKKMRVILLRLIAHRLTQNKTALSSDVAALHDVMKKSGRQQGYAASLLSELNHALAEDSEDQGAILAALNDTLDQFEKQPSTMTLEVPDLVTQVGNDKAADFLRRALASNCVVRIQIGDETKKLARKIALETVDALKMPQWGLVDTIDSTALFEAMQKRFKDKAGMDSYAYGTARTCYLLGLIAAGRTQEATEFAIKLGDEASVSLPDGAIEALERAGLTAELVKFLHDLLEKNPDLPFWSDYTDLAVKAGEQDKMVALAEAAAARPGLNGAKQRTIQHYLGNAYLAVGRVDDGIVILRAEIAAGKEDTTGGNSPHGHIPANAQRNSPIDSGFALARLGAVLDRKELVEEGIQAVRNGMKQQTPEELRSNPARYAMTLATFLIEQGRGPEAEAVLGEALAVIGRQQAEAGSENDSSTARELLVLLMDVYHRANRPADVLALLNHAPQWGAKDLAEVFTQETTIDRNEEYAGYFAASALAAQNQKEKARKILDTVLDAEGGYDPAYELFIKLAPGQEVIARLDALFARDKYESRPLIWKAKLLLDAGKAEDAEKVARQAVTIDPSDGHHGPGRRMRVYAVLADIRAARGDEKEAEFLRGAVTAIRHSENGDRFYEAGLISQAVKMYQEALTHFADAYCIQSRLALRMAEIGDMAGAEEHYRRAYELMPDSFGRVESHCFGCERAFAGERAQGIAEKVFTNLVKTRPEKPQVHYLLGYLRYAQGRYSDALPSFREAVKLDPEYLNAWKKISEVGREMHLTASENDAVELNILRLDPLQRHSSFNSSNIGDLATAWTAMEAASGLQPPKPEGLYPLKAAADELSKPAPAAAQNRRMQRRYFPREREDRLDARTMVASNRFMRSISYLMNGSRAIFGTQGWD